MEGVAPDLATAVIGFRQWRMVGTELWSLRDTDRWRRGVQTAVCDEGAHDGPAPAKGCTCGIHAWYVPPPRGASAATSDLVAGAVALWGRVELHAHGMRAQHAMVVALALPLSRGAKRRRVLAAASALDVVAVQARGLQDAALRQGEMIPRRMRPRDTIPHKRKAPGAPAPARLYAVADGYAGRRSAASRSGECRARLIPDEAFARICHRAIACGQIAPSSGYLAAHGDEDHLAILPRAVRGGAVGMPRAVAGGAGGIASAVAGGAGGMPSAVAEAAGGMPSAVANAAAGRRVVIALPCGGLSLGARAACADGSLAPTLPAAALLARDQVIVEVPLAELRDAAAVLVREPWFEAAVVERAGRAR